MLSPSAVQGLSGDLEAATALKQPCPMSNQQAMCDQMPTLSRLAERQSVSIAFHDLGCYVGARGKTKILHDVSGQFQNGHMTAIMGSSGAGKSTLLDILTGNRTRGVTGSVTVNGSPRQLSLFRRLSCYVMQEDLLQPNLTLIEAVSIAARLKLGHELSNHETRTIVDEVLNSLGLSECCETFTHKLSGGQRKRFLIAQELVNNPAVLFLDEPTTGLDLQTSSQCVQLLKMLARQGRTVVCSIHQPSASIFTQFDEVYLMTKGYCAYQGRVQLVVPFFASVGFQCPKTHNPADYVIEVLHEDINDAVQTLTSAIQNGKSFIRESENPEQGSFTSCRISSIDKGSKVLDVRKVQSASFYLQFCVLVKRMFMQYYRNKLVLILMFGTYFSGGLAVGMVFFQTGNSGDRALTQINFMATSLIMACYCQILTPALLYPSELELVRREYKNGWYSLNPYFAAASLVRLPFMHGMTVICVFLSYFLSGQPAELDRFVLYFLLFVLVSIISESFGLLVGTMVRAQLGAVLGPCIVSPIVALWQYNLGAYDTTSAFMKIMMSMSFFRVGMALTMMKDREPLDCDLVYCPFRYPQALLKLLAAENQSLTVQIFGLIAMIVVLRFLWYILIRLRISSEFYNTWINYVYKVRHR